MLVSTLTLSLFVSLTACARVKPQPATTTAAASPLPTVSVPLDGVTYVNHGLVAFGLILPNVSESTGDTIGGIGSAMAIKPGSWKKTSDGKYTGTLVMQPDRGFNILTTIDYQARRHEISFTLAPYTGAANLSFVDAQKTLQLKYENTTLLTERQRVKTSGLDPAAVRPASKQSGASQPLEDPQMPIASEEEPHLSVDAEGIAINADGTYWLSDEYGPYIYHFSANGELIQTIQPPEAILPLDASGNLNFSALDDPATGRGANQGFEGLTLDPESNTLYAMLQSATIQDGAEQLARMLAYDVRQPDVQVPLIGEYVVPLPQSSKGKTRATSEIHFVKPGVFLSLARDGNGHGDDGGDTGVNYKHADLFSIENATNIANTKFDTAAVPVAPDGVLDPTVVPATYLSFVDLAEEVGLARFGLHIGDPDDRTLINAKWESLALAPVDEEDAPDDFFLFAASDNDFLTTQGISLGAPYDAGIDGDNQFLVYRVTLPGAAAGVRKALKCN